jgi:hypothetical protein
MLQMLIQRAGGSEQDTSNISRHLTTMQERPGLSMSDT